MAYCIRKKHVRPHSFSTFLRPLCAETVSQSCKFVRSYGRGHISHTACRPRRLVSHSSLLVLRYIEQHMAEWRCVLGWEKLKSESNPVQCLAFHLVFYFFQYRSAGDQYSVRFRLYSAYLVSTALSLKHNSTWGALSCILILT